jgi:hypothetical protein
LEAFAMSQAQPERSRWESLLGLASRLSLRERQGFKLALGVLALALLWRLAWLPLMAYVSPPSATLESLQERMHTLERQQQEAAALRALPTVPLAQGQKSFEQITHNLMPQAQLRFNDRQVSVSLGAVSPQDLAKWMLSIKEQVSGKVIQSDLARTRLSGNAPGASNAPKFNPNNPAAPPALWTGRLVFEFASEP